MARVLGLFLSLALPILAGDAAQPATAEVPDGKPTSIAVHFAPKPVGDPDGMDVHLVNFFARAKKTLHGAFYELREQKFVDALVAAKGRKVDVKMLVDNTSYYLKLEDGTFDKKRRNPFVKQLLEAGIEVRHDQNRSALMHNKFCVVDNRWVWSGSVNLTDTYATNCNNGVEIESPKLAAIYEREFDKKFTKQLFGKNAPSYAEEQKCRIGSVEAEVLYAPEDDPMSRILVLLNSAKKSVHFMQFAFTDEQVTTILITKFRMGIKVAGLFDHRLYRSTGPYGDFSTLCRAGVPVQLYAGAGLMHHKVFIIDAGTPHAKVITGSQNSSANGNNNNDENVLILHDQAIADLYMADFNKRLQESSQVDAGAVYRKDPVAGSTMPAVDVAITANGVDVRRLKVEYPARWPLDTDRKAGISIWRNGKNVTKSVGLEYYAKGLYINNPGMTPTGPDCLLELHIRTIKVPEIAGVYNLYISVAQGDSPDELKPCRTQPTINVLPAEAGAASVRELVAGLTVSRPNGAAASRDEAPAPADEAAHQDALLTDIGDQAESADLTAAQQYVEAVESLAASGQSAVTALRGRGREVRRSLRTIDASSPAFASAQALLKRLELAAAK